MGRKDSLYINQEWISGKGSIFSSYNPATHEKIWEGTSAAASDVDLAIQAAKSAFPSWSNMPLEERKDLLRSFEGHLREEKEDLAKTISMENGKPLWEAQQEVAAMMGKIGISIDAYDKRCAELSVLSGGRRSVTQHKPHGVVAVLGPFNFPGHLPNGHIVPALLAGNTVVFKPSELTPLTAEKTLKIWEKAGLPKGVLNLVQGDREAGSFLVENPKIDGLFFTGSWNAGKHFMEWFAKNGSGQILALEMGGNNPLIVTEAAHPQAAAYLTIQSAYLTSGQRCTCARRLIVPRGQIGDAFLKELLTMIQSLQIGPYTDSPEPFMGPVISDLAAEKLLFAQRSLQNQGGDSLIEMKQLEIGKAFLTPGLIDVTAIHNRSDEEYFGPLLQLIRVDNFEEALEEANRTAYGLTAGLISRHHSEFEHFSKTVKAGILTWNTPTTNASSALPFGGIGKSGNHRPTAYYAADYCAYPVTHVEEENQNLPTTLLPGIRLRA